MESGDRILICDLVTARLRLRPLALSDAPTIQQVFPDWEVAKYLSDQIPWPYPDDGAITFVESELERIEEGTHFTWAITLMSDPNSTLIGLISLMPHSKSDHRGFWLSRPFWGQGIMREAADRVTEFAFETLKLSELKLANAAANEGSRRIKIAAGAELVETTEENFVSGRLASEKWVLTAERWRDSRK